MRYLAIIINCFTSTGITLSNKVIDPGKNRRNKRTLKSILLTQTIENEISLFNKWLKNNYSNEIDGLNNITLKVIEIAIVQVHFNSISVAKKIFPNWLKKAVVIPIHKVGNAEKTENLLLIVFTQLLEKIIQRIFSNKSTHFSKNLICCKIQLGSGAEKRTTDLSDRQEGVKPVEVK